MCVHLSGGPPAAPPAAAAAPLLDMQQALDARMAALQQQLSARSAQLADLRDRLTASERQVAARDAEVARLGRLLGSGPDVDKLARDQAASASENIILALNRQVRQESDCIQTQPAFMHASWSA